MIRSKCCSEPKKYNRRWQKEEVEEEEKIEIKMMLFQQTRNWSLREESVNKNA